MRHPTRKTIRSRLSTSTIVKLVLIEIAVSSFAFAFSAFTTTRSLRDSLYSEVSQKSRLALSALRVSTALLLRESKPDEIQRLIENTGASRIVKSLRLISAADRAIVASTDPAELGKAVDSPLIAKAILSGSLFEMSAIDEIDEGFAAIVPVSGAVFDTHLNSDTVAFLEYQADMSVERALENKVNQALVAQTAYILVLMLVATLFAWFLIISKPVRGFLTVTERVAKGDYDARIDIQHHDELAMFAQAFNSMVEEVGRKNEELFKYSETLEAKVEERTQSLLLKTKELEETRQRAIEAERIALAGRIAGGVAHEINNPSAFVMSNLGHIGRSLASISAMCDKLVASASFDIEDIKRLDGLLEDVPQVIVESMDGIKRITTIVKSLELSAFPEKGGKVRADLSDMLSKAIDDTCAEIEAFGRVSCELAPGLKSAEAPVLLPIAFGNVLSNAVSAAGETGKVTIVSQEDDGYATIRFSDTGPGIPESIIQNIFEPFFTTKDPGKGIGLGLTVAKAIVESGGGEISVESSPGNTVVTIRLPLEAQSRERS